MSSEAEWARIVEAVTRPDAAPSPEERAGLAQAALSLAGEAVPDLVGCSVTQAVDTDMGPGYRTPVASNQVAISLDYAQYAVNDGPCVAACRDGTLHSVAVMADETNFAGFTAAALEHGVRSSLSLPLRHSRPSAINLYAADVHAFGAARPRAVASFLARCVAGLLPDASPAGGHGMPSTLDEQRALVDRACAVLAGDGAAPGEAFHRLTVLSRQQQRSVFDVARAVVASAAPGEGS